MALRPRKSDVHEKWTKEDILKLLTSIKSQLIEGDTCIYSRRIELLDWNEIQIDGKSISDCKLQLEQVIKKIHRIRTLAEILSDVDLKNFNVTSFGEENKSDLKGFMKKVSVKLEKLSQIQNYESKLCRNGSGSQNEDIEKTLTDVEVSVCKEEPKEPKSSFNFFAMSSPTQMDYEPAAKAYQSLRKEDRNVYIEMSKKAKIQYKLDLANYVLALTPCERTQYLNRLQLETEAKNDVIINLKNNNDVVGNSEKNLSLEQYHNDNETTSNSSGICLRKQKRKAKETLESVNKKIRKEIQEPTNLPDEENNNTIVLMTNLHENEKTTIEKDNTTIEEENTALETEKKAHKSEIKMETRKVATENVNIFTPVSVSASEHEDSKTIESGIELIDKKPLFIQFAMELNDTLPKSEMNEVAGKFKIKKESRSRPYFNSLKNICSGFLTRFERVWGNKEN